MRRVAIRCVVGTLTATLAGLVSAIEVGGSPGAGTTPVPCMLDPMPASGPVGTRVELRGTCPGILYHRLVSVYFDYTLVGLFDGVEARYATSFSVPRRARSGPHEVRMHGGLIPSTATGVFEVTGEPAACEGDCNLDDKVTIDELITGLNIALKHISTSDCMALDTDENEAVGIDELMQAVRAALFGCDPVPTCHDDLECESPSSCLAPGEHGCGICQPIESNCQFDADCHAADLGQICAPVRPQHCCPPALVCQPGCTSDAECAEGEVCNAAHHCALAPCAGDSCPPHFQCEPRDGAFTCHRILCDRDSRCGAGSCVNGACYAALGTCSLPVP